VKRREFIKLVGGAAVGWPLAAYAQQPGMPVIGFLSSGAAEMFVSNLARYHEGLREVGYVQGRNVTIEYRWAAGQYDRLPALAAELAKFGIVASLSRPNGHVTGVTLFISELMAKRLELLSQAIPSSRAIAGLVNPKNPNAEAEAKEIEAAARRSGRPLHLLNASTDSEIETAFEFINRQRLGPLLVGTNTFFYSRRDQLVALAARHFVPAIYFEREFATAGGLMSYGPSFSGEWRQAGVYTGRILKGERPADLPVLQPTTFEFVINVKTAKALGVELPATLRALADEVIE
jgi:putative ABC transport system substrate-binding protein